MALGCHGHGGHTRNGGEPRVLAGVGRLSRISEQRQIGGSKGDRLPFGIRFGPGGPIP